MGEGAYGNEIHAGTGDFAQGFPSDATAGFELRFAAFPARVVELTVSTPLVFNF